MSETGLSYTLRRAARVKPGGDAERARVASILIALVMLSAGQLGGRPDLALTGSRDSKSMLNRAVAVYIAHTVFQIPMASAGVAVGLSQTGALRAVQRVEDMRSDEKHEWAVSRIEEIARFCLGEGEGHADKAA